MHSLPNTVRVHMLFVPVLLLYPPTSLTGNAAITFGSNGTMRDSWGSFADDNSNIIFGEPTTSQGQFKSQTDIIDNGMWILHLVARGTERLILGSNYPYDIVVSLKKGTFNRYTGTDFVLNYILFTFFVLAHILLGIAYFTVFWHFVACLCCFRESCLASTLVRDFKFMLRLSIILGVLLIFSITFNIIALAANDHSIQALDESETIINNAVHDVKTFIESSVGKMNFIFEKVEFAKEVLLRDLGNVKSLMGTVVRAKIEENSGLKEAKDELLAFKTMTSNGLYLLKELQVEWSSFENYLNEINNRLQTVGQQCQAPGCTAGPPPQIPNLPQLSLDSIVKEFEQVNADDLNTKIESASGTLAAILNRTETASTAQITDLKQNIQDQTSKIKEFQNVTDDFLKLKDNPSLEEYRGLAISKLATVAFYNIFRRIVVLVLLLIDLLSLLLLLVGNIVAILSKSELAIAWINKKLKRKPGMQYSNIHFNNCARKTLFCGVFIFLMLGWLLMLIAIATFALGASLDAFVCQAALDPDLTALEELENTHLIFDQKNFISTSLINNPNGTVTVSSVIKNCRDDMTAYKAFQLDESPDVKLSKLLDFKKDLDLDSKMDSINVAVDPVNILSPEVEDHFKNLAAVEAKLPYDQLIDLDKQDMSSAVTAYRASLPPSLQAQLQDVSQIKPRQQGICVLGKRMKEVFNPGGVKLSVRIDTVLQNVRDAQTQIPNRVSDAVKEGATSFKDRLLRTVTVLVDEVKKSVEKDYGKCYPLYNIWKAVVMDFICANVLNALNGLWFGILLLHYFMIPWGLIILLQWLRQLRILESGEKKIHKKYLDAIMCSIECCNCCKCCRSSTSPQ